MILKIVESFVISIFTTLCCGIVAFLIGKELDTKNRIVIVSRSLICSIIIQLGYVFALMYNFIGVLAIIQSFGSLASMSISFKSSDNKIKLIRIMNGVLYLAFIGIYLYGGKSNIVISLVGCTAIQTLVSSKYDPILLTYELKKISTN